MKRMPWAALLDSVGQGPPDPVYLFTGKLPEPGRREGSAWAESRSRPELYNRRKVLQEMKARLVEPAFREINFVEISAVEKSLDEIALLAAQLPAFADRRIVVVSDLDRRFKPKGTTSPRGADPSGSTGQERVTQIRDEIEEARSLGFEVMIEYLGNPSPSTTLIFLWDRPDRRGKFAEALIGAASVVEFPRPDKREAQNWIRNQVRQRHCSIDPAALELLLEYVGLDLELLSHELEKLMINVESGPIRANHVEALATRMREDFGFELIDQISARNAGQALRITRRRLKDGEEPLVLLGSIAAYLRRTILAKELMDAGAPAEKVLAAARVQSFKDRQYLPQLRAVSMKELIHGLKRAAEVDDAIKQSRGTPALQLEMLVYRLCNPLLLRL
ncbi:MAG: DNA polymerase III subunit delta [Acidobacteria bacterium]|nr:DNA polymerase III subunit delta [Acidobacteriota bacterium]